MGPVPDKETTKMVNQSAASSRHLVMQDYWEQKEESGSGKRGRKAERSGCDLFLTEVYLAVGCDVFWDTCIC